MEQKKILWIMGITTFGLLLVVTAGFLWFFPWDNAGADTQTASAQNGYLDHTVIIRDLEEYMDLDPEAAVESTDVPVGDAAEQGTDPGDSSEEATAADPEAMADASTSDGTPVLRESGAGATSAGSTASGSQGSASSSAPAAPTTTTSTAPAATPGTTSTGTSEATAEVAAETLPAVTYWIQVGSFASTTKAESVRDELAEKGLATKITSKQVDDTTYFRVRIGPYETKNAAEGFLPTVRGIPGLEGSWVSQVAN